MVEGRHRTSQRTRMIDPKTRTVERGLTMGQRGGLGGGGKGENNWDNCNRVNNEQ